MEMLELELKNKDNKIQLISEDNGERMYINNNGEVTEIADWDFDIFEYLDRLVEGYQIVKISNDCVYNIQESLLNDVGSLEVYAEDHSVKGLEIFLKYCKENEINIKNEIYNIFEGVNKMEEKKMMEKFEKKMNKLNWNVNESLKEIEKGEYICLENHSPAGENLIIEIEYNGNFNEYLEELKSYLQAFDTDEHIKMWVENSNVSGVPSIRLLVKDAEEIEEMYSEIINIIETEEF